MLNAVHSETTTCAVLAQFCCLFLQLCLIHGFLQCAEVEYDGSQNMAHTHTSMMSPASPVRLLAGASVHRQPFNVPQNASEHGQKQAESDYSTYYWS